MTHDATLDDFTAALDYLAECRELPVAERDDPDRLHPWRLAPSEPVPTRPPRRLPPHVRRRLERWRDRHKEGADIKEMADAR